MLAVVRNREEPQARTAHKAQSYVSTHPKAPQHLEEMEWKAATNSPVALSSRPIRCSGPGALDTMRNAASQNPRVYHHFPQ